MRPGTEPSAARPVRGHRFRLIAWSFWAVGTVALSLALMPSNLGPARWVIGAGFGYVLAVFPLLVLRLVCFNPGTAFRWSLTVLVVISLAAAMFLCLPGLKAFGSASAILSTSSASPNAETSFNTQVMRNSKQETF